MDELTDMELVRKYAATDSDEVFAEIVRRRLNLVYSVAMRRLGDAHLAEEVTQAVFIILARKAGSLKPGTVLSGWLYQTAQLTAANYQRSVFRRQRREQEAAMQFIHESEPDDSWKRLQPLLEDAMAHLGAKERDAIVLRFFENRSVGEVAVALQVNESAAQKRVNRATEKLRKFFSRRGVQVSAGVLVASIGTNSIQAAPVSVTASVVGAAALKGAAASVTTLTLIQGTLKIMAWTKLKTSLVIGAVALLAAGTGVVSVQAVKYWRVSRYPNLQGAWEGTIAAGPAKLRVVLKVVKTNGTYVATMDSIDQNAKDMEVDNVTYAYPKFNFEMKSIGAAYKGTLDSGATQMSGNWKQMGSMPLTLKRTSEPDVVLDPLTAADCARRKDSDLQGIWEGQVKLNDKTVPVELKIAEPTAGTFRAEAGSSALGVSAPASAITYNRPSVSIEFGGAGGSLEGTVDTSDTEISGTLTLAGQSQQHVTLKREDTAAAEQHDLAKDYTHSGPDDIAGHWSGALNVHGTRLRLKVDIAKLPDDKFECSVTSVDQGGVVIPATAVKFDAPKLRIEWTGIGSTFNGEIKNGKLPGKWVQGGMSLPLLLDRAGK